MGNNKELTFEITPNNVRSDTSGDTTALTMFVNTVVQTLEMNPEFDTRNLKNIAFRFDYTRMEQRFRSAPVPPVPKKASSRASSKRDDVKYCRLLTDIEVLPMAPCGITDLDRDYRSVMLLAKATADYIMAPKQTNVTYPV